MSTGPNKIAQKEEKVTGLKTLEHEISKGKKISSAARDLSENHPSIKSGFFSRTAELLSELQCGRTIESRSNNR